MLAAMIKPVLAIFASFVAAVVFVFNPELVRAGIGILYRWQTLAAGSLAILAAVIGWFAIQKQIAAASDLEARRHEKDRIILAASLLAEIKILGAAYLSAQRTCERIESGAMFSDAAHLAHSAPVLVDLLRLPEKNAFDANEERIGLLGDRDLEKDLAKFHRNVRKHRIDTANVDETTAAILLGALGSRIKDQVKKAIRLVNDLERITDES